MYASTPNIEMGSDRIVEMTRSEIDHTKRYTINGAIADSSVHTTGYMKKSATTLKYAPPTLNYEQSVKSNIANNTGLNGVGLESNLNRGNYIGQSSGVSKQSRISQMNKNEDKLLISVSNENIQAKMPNGSLKLISKHKTDQKINY